jgi:hypothetical protein
MTANSYFMKSIVYLHHMAGEKIDYFTLDEENPIQNLAEDEIRIVEARSEGITLSDEDMAKLAVCRVERNRECLQPEDCSRMTCWVSKMGWQ